METNDFFSWSHRGWQLGDTFPVKVLACALKDPDFLAETFDCLDPCYFGKKICLSLRLSSLITSEQAESFLIVRT